MKIGYARVSTEEQNLDLQIDTLKESGCEKIYTDKASGRKEQRPGLNDMLTYVRPGDVIVTWKLDRLGRSTKGLIELITDLQNKGVEFKSLKENIDTTTAGGKLIFHVFAALAEFEADIIRERTHAGLAAARARGRKGGRPRVLSESQMKQMIVMSKDKNISVIEICETFKIKRSPYYKYINENR